MNLLDLLFLAVGLIFGAGFTWVLVNGRITASVKLAEATIRAELSGEVIRLASQLDAERKQFEFERTQAAKNLTFLQEAKDDMSNRFKTLAQEILEDKSQRFTEQNKTNIGQILEPLQTKLKDFQEQVQKSYVDENVQRGALAAQVRELMAMNKQLSDEAQNLTSALKGSNKTQGNWGEMILARVLENSGLRKGYEYDVQQSHTLEDGSRLQPDVVIHLPEDRHLVVDAKVSLTAYEKYALAADDRDREATAKLHLDSVRAHIKGLSPKNYQDLYQLKSLDFVLMFIPIEPAFMLAVTHDSELFMDAWEKNVLLVSPSTLLFVVRTVAHLWRQQEQSANAQDIAKQGAVLYDKFTAFAADLEKIGDRIKQTQASYESAHTKLTGRGSLVYQAQKLQQLGVKPTKSMPAGLLHETDHNPLE